jgi:hypothetical protein
MWGTIVRSGRFLALILPLALMVILLMPERPSLLRWKSDADVEVILMSGPEHDVSRWWDCSWSNECPKHTWEWCLRLVPLTPEGAWRIYNEYYEAEINDIGLHQDPGGPTRSEYLRLVKVPESDPGLQRVVMVEKDLARAKSDRAGLLRDLQQRMRKGIVTGAVHTRSRAGKPNESRSWYLLPQATQKCMAQ